MTKTLITLTLIYFGILSVWMYWGLTHAYSQ